MNTKGQIRAVKGAKIEFTLTFWLDWPTCSIPRDLSGVELLMQIRKNQAAEPTLTFKTTAGATDGSLTVSGTGHNIITGSLSSDKNMAEVGNYFWDIKTVTNDNSDTYITPLALPFQVADPITE